MQSVVFTDFDAFEESVRGGDMSLMIEHPVRPRWSIESMRLSDTHLQHGQPGSGIIATGQFRPDEQLLYLPLTDTCEWSANGTPVGKDSLVVVEPGCEFCITSRCEHEWCAFSFPAQPPSPASKNAACWVSRPDRALFSRFRDVAQQALLAARASSDFENSPAASHAKAELLQTSRAVVAQRATARPGPHAGRPPVDRKRIIDRCLRIFDEREGEAIHMTELASAGQVSPRTLRRVFTEYFGVGPLRYLQTRQMALIHKTLKNAEPDATTVTEVVFNQGVWELSRFAGRYRQWYGELPSETLRGS